MAFQRVFFCIKKPKIQGGLKFNAYMVCPFILFSFAMQILLGSKQRKRNGSIDLSKKVCYNKNIITQYKWLFVLRGANV